LYAGEGKETRREGLPPPCPECGRPRERCRKARMEGARVCRSHGGRGIVARAFIPGYSSLDDEEIATLEKMVEEDDTSLTREFHTLRVLLNRALEHAQKVNLGSDSDGHNDAMGEVRQLAGIIDRLSAIAERRAKISAIAPREEQVVRVQFDDPRVQHLVKEKLREMHLLTIRKVLAIVIQYVDPNGQLGIAQKMPKSLVPYLPSGGETKELEISNSKEVYAAFDNMDKVP
jgi:hypothetical protein